MLIMLEKSTQLNYAAEIVLKSVTMRLDFLMVLSELREILDTCQKSSREAGRGAARSEFSRRD